MDSIKLAKLLSNSGHVYLICKEDSHIDDCCSKDSTELPFDKLAINFRSKNFSIAIIRSLSQYIEKYNIKNIIFFGASELKSIYWALKNTDVNLIVRHGTSKSRKKDSIIHKIIYSRVDHHVSVSRHLEKNIKNILPIHDGVKLHVIYPSFDVSYLGEKRKKKTECIELLHVGRLVEGKGQRDAIEACDILYKNNIDFRLRLVGGVDNDDYETFLRNYIDSSSYADRIELIGYDSDVTKYYKTSHIFLFPSYGEGFGNSFCEAMVSGLECVAYDNTVFPEFPELGFRIRLVKDRDVEALSVALHEVVLSVIEKSFCGDAKNVELGKVLFSMEREIDNWVSFLV